MIKETVNSLKWPCKIILTTSEQDKFSAMAVNKNL